MSKNPMPKKVLDEVMERDEGICQLCGIPGKNIHHIVYGGTGRKRIHGEYNLITLCLNCHDRVHSENYVREKTYEWSRKHYGNKIDKLLKEKWSDDL